METVRFREQSGRTWTLVDVFESGLYATCDRDDGLRDVLVIVNGQLWRDRRPLTALSDVELRPAKKDEATPP